MRRDQHLVSGTEPDRGHRRRERVAAAGGEREVPDAEMLGIALLEAVALAADALAEQCLFLDHPGQRVDLLLADDVHSRSS
jgi:hypothetical protein